MVKTTTVSLWDIIKINVTYLRLVSINRYQVLKVLSYKTCSNRINKTRGDNRNHDRIIPSGQYHSQQDLSP